VIYFIGPESPKVVKIGHAMDLRCRLNTLRTFSPVPLTCFGTMAGGFEEEAELHERFAHLRQHGEWFDHDEELSEFIAKNAEPMENQSTKWGGKPYWHRGSNFAVICTGGFSRNLLAMAKARGHSFSRVASDALKLHAVTKGFPPPPPHPECIRMRLGRADPDGFGSFVVKANPAFVAWVADFARSQPLPVSRLVRDAVENLPEFESDPLTM
jgi:hypothetical protein